MLEQLNFLIELQQIDKTLQHILLTIEENPRKIKQIDQETQQVQSTFEAFVREMEETKKQRKILEGEVEDFDQRIKKSQVKLMEVKTNKEYKAMLTEIDELKKAKSGKEDRLLELLEKVEEGAGKEKTLKNNLEDKVSEGKLQKDQLEKEGQEHEKQLSELNRKRIELSSRMDSALLRQYEFLKDRLKGLAVAGVKDAACLGCHMHIPPQLFNELHRRDRIITCPSCLRILYLVGPSGNKED
ncbi:MAG: hypothetical protein A2Y79_04075 [Deltaproteobacteria bacterium RBG_13_43_22]|nr:MAG: hypothetical protein A2Y79_04075 [Deltaproteobacteria bacterium RBG_13_43_22]